MQIQALSFTLDDDDEEDEAATCSADDSDTEKYELPLKKKVRKNPDVDTSFLPDREREDEENRLREELRQVRNFFPEVQSCTACECCHHLGCASYWKVFSKPRTYLCNLFAKLNMQEQYLCLLLCSYCAY